MGGARAAIAFLTVTPGIRARAEFTPGAIPWFPIVGAGMGVVVAFVFASASLILPETVAATLAVAAGVAITGALHEDGLADTFDSLGVKGSRRRALEGMRDPRVGVYGACAVFLALLIRVATVAAIGPSNCLFALPAAFALSRATPVLTAYRGHPPPEAGLSGGFIEAVDGRRVLATCGVAAGVAVALLGLWSLPAIAIVIGVAIAARVFGQAKIGGVNGDILGASQQFAEIGVLLVAAVAITTRVAPLGWFR